MELPRWLMIGLWTSIVLAVLAAAGWWWVTWPERTAREFVRCIAEGRFEDVKTMLQVIVDVEDEWGRGLDLSDERWQVAFRQIRFKLEPRTASDLLRGRQRFEDIKVDVRAGRLKWFGYTYQITAQFCVISLRPTNSWSSTA